MEDLALVRLAVLSSYLGRLRSPGEYARRELAGWLDGAWLTGHIDYESLAAAWLSGGRIVVVDGPGDGEIAAGVFVLRGPW